MSRWIKGYSYWLTHPEATIRRKLPAVVETDLPQISETFALSFLELIELRIVKAFVDRGVPLQRVRVAYRLASEVFQTRRPFATHRVYVSGRHVFAELPTEDILQLTHGRRLQIQSGPIVKPFLDEVEFAERTAFAQRWWPLGRSKPVVLDPAIAFGAPIVEGTAVRTDVVADLARRVSPEVAAQAFRLTLEQAQAAAEYETRLAQAA